MTQAAAWGPAIVAVVAGLILGVVVAFVARRDDSNDTDDQLTDLQAQHNNSIFLLRELQRRRDELAADVYEKEQHALEQRAVATLRQRDALLAKHESASHNEVNPASARLTWIVGALTVVALGVWFAIPSTATLTNQPNRAADDAGSIADPELEAIWARLREDPADVEALVRAGQLLLAKGMLQQAAPAIERALLLEPEHAGALLSYAELLASRGDSRAAQTQLDNLLVKYPDYLQAWSLRAAIALEEGNKEVARQSLEEYAKRAPDGPNKERAMQMLEEGALNQPSEQPSPRK